MPFFMPFNASTLLASLTHRRVARRPLLHAAHFERVLGTTLDLRLRARGAGEARTAQAALLAEIDRLEAVYSRFLPHSELNAWLATCGEEVTVSAELGALLREGEAWRARTESTFHPGADALGALWREAAALGERPEPRAVAEVLRELRGPPYRVRADGRAATRLARVTLNFNAFAKGRVADLAGAAALAVDGVTDVLLNLGGDLRHLGTGDATLAVADPRANADNAPPLARVRVCGQGLATSGGAHRGYRVDGAWHSHVLDPRTGESAGHVISATVLADDCGAADALATALSVLSVREGLALADHLPRVGCLLVTQGGEIFSNTFWRRHAVGSTSKEQR